MACGVFCVNQTKNSIVNLMEVSNHKNIINPSKLSPVQFLMISNPVNFVLPIHTLRFPSELHVIVGMLRIAIGMTILVFTILCNPLSMFINSRIVLQMLPAWLELLFLAYAILEITSFSRDIVLLIQLSWYLLS